MRKEGLIVEIIVGDNDLKWEQFLHLGKREFIKAGQTIYKAGEEGKYFYYLNSGFVKLSLKTTSNKWITFRLVINYQLFGLQALDQLIHYATAQTLSNCVIYKFSLKDIEQIVHTNNEAYHFLISKIVEEMDILTQKIEAFNLSAERKLAKLLLNIFYFNTHLQLQLSKKEIANCIGTSRITIYKILKDWEEQQYIQFDQKRITILQPDQLLSIDNEQATTKDVIICN